MGKTLSDLQKIPVTPQPTPGQGVALDVSGRVPVAALPFTRGSGTLTWPGGSILSTALVVSHGLGSTPTAVMATCGLVSGGVAVIVAIQTHTYTSTSFSVDAETIDGSNPVVGSTATITWVAFL